MSLSKAIIYSNLDSIKQIIDAGAPINDIDEYGFTPLIQTAIENKVDVAKLLIDYGADVNLPDLVNRTALHWAADNNNHELCRLLLEKGANPNAYTIGSQPVLTFAMLHKQERTKQLLYSYGADFHFASDYINTKTLGHRFELKGVVDIFCTPEKRFLEIEYEGFFLDVTVALLLSSVNHYCRHYAARPYRTYLPFLKRIAHALQTAAELCKYKHYLTDYHKQTPVIDNLLNTPLLVLPVGYEGHAITFVQYGPYLAICDRGEQSHLIGSTNIYQMHNAQAFSNDFIKDLIYKKQHRHFITKTIHQVLGLQQVFQLPIESQLSGNCSWANVEAVLPTMLFMLLQEANPQQRPAQTKALAMEIFHHWREWDKDIALNECIQSFYRASPARKATKAATLGAILFQRCDYHIKQDIKRAEKMLPALTDPNYDYVLKSYLKAYWLNGKTEEGNKLLKMLDLCGIDIPFDSIR